MVYQFFFYAYHQSTFFIPKIFEQMIFKLATNDSFSFSYAVECASHSCWRNWQSSQWEFLGNGHRLYLLIYKSICSYGFLIIRTAPKGYVMYLPVKPFLSWYCPIVGFGFQDFV